MFQHLELIALHISNFLEVVKMHAHSRGESRTLLYFWTVIPARFRRESRTKTAWIPVFAGMSNLMRFMNHDTRPQLFKLSYFFFLFFLSISAIHDPSSLSAASSGSAFLKISPSPRAYALGRSDAVSALGAQALSANPANLHIMSSRMELSSSFLSLMGDARYAHAAFAVNRSPSGTRLIDAIGVSATRLSVGDFDGRDGQGNPTGSFDTGDTAFALTMASRLQSGLRVGLTAKAIQSEIAGYKSNMGLAADAGVSYPLSILAKPVSLNLSVNNVGRGVKFISQTDPLPTSLSAGAAVGIGPAAGVIQVSRLVNDDMTNFSLGLEYGMGPVSLRAGYRTESGSGSNLASQNQNGFMKLFQNLTTGLGLNIGRARMDYALSQDIPEFGMSHRISLTMKWGERGRMSQAKRQAPKGRIQAKTTNEEYAARRRTAK